MANGFFVAMAIAGLMLTAGQAEAQTNATACLNNPILAGGLDPDLRDLTVRYDPAIANHELAINACLVSNLDLASASVAFAAFDAQGHLIGGSGYGDPIGWGQVTSNDPKIVARFLNYVPIQANVSGTQTKWVLVDVKWTPNGGCAIGKTCATRFLVDVSEQVQLPIVVGRHRK